MESPSLSKVTVETQKNGFPERKLAVPTVASRSKRPKPGYFGRIEPADPSEILRPLYADPADLPEYGS